MENIFKRRSIRRYKDKKIEDEKVEKLLRAAMQAPSAGNQQPWEFIIVQDKDKLLQLSQLSSYAKPIKHAPMIIIVLANKEKMRFSESWEQDLGAATQNILLEAVELGLGAVWLGVAPIEDRMSYIKNMFNLNENIKPYSVVAVGYPMIDDENKFIDRFDEAKVHYENY